MATGYLVYIIIVTNFFSKRLSYNRVLFSYAVKLIMGLNAVIESIMCDYHRNYPT